jgi:hypothetical protein
MIESQLLRLALTILSVYRVAELFSVDDGPTGIFRRLRSFFGRKAADNGANNGDYNLWVQMTALISCPFCIGVWLSFMSVIFVAIPSLVGDLFLIGFGIAGAQTFLEQISSRKVE